VATTLRTASRNDWGALLWSESGSFAARTRTDLEILDRVGGGDSFASGMIYAFLAGMGPAEAVEWGAAHGALAMTTPGDASMATRDEVERLVRGGSGRVIR
jgi:2-dehydro-3-deoxygluconokinase